MSMIPPRRGRDRAGWHAADALWSSAKHWRAEAERFRDALEVISKLEAHKKIGCVYHHEAGRICSDFCPVGIAIRVLRGKS